MSKDYSFVQTFDPVRKLQYVNDDPSVMHCHHFATLYTKLAVDMKDIRGPELMREAMEESFYIVLKKAFIVRGTMSKEEKIKIAEEHFRLCGLGKARFSVGETGGNVELSHSHLDEGWIKKWQRQPEPVNFMGQGYIAAAFSLINGKSLRSYQVKETQSIVSGAPTSKFTVTLKEEA